MENFKRILDVIMWTVFVTVCVLVLGVFLSTLIIVLWNVSKGATVMLISFIISGIWILKRI